MIDDREQWHGPKLLLAAIALAALAVAPYVQTAWHEFLNYDDVLYVTDNMPVQRGLTWEGAAWAVTAFDAANWHPLTWLSHMADCSLFGLQPAGHHLMNVALHALNTLLLWTMLRRMAGAMWQSAGVAALFAVHPLRVESVAWVA